MQKAIKLFLLICSIFALSACGPMYQTYYSYIPPHSWRGRKCVNQCLAEHNTCRYQCAMQDQSCQMNANLEALPSYIVYEHQQANAGNPNYATVSDFADTSGCSDQCGCASSYRACFANCGGQVIANTVCTAFCNG